MVVEPGVPLANCHENGYGRNDRFGQRQDQFCKYGQVSGSVYLCGLILLLVDTGNGSL